MPKSSNPPPQKPAPQRSEPVKWDAIFKATNSQTALQIRLLDGSRHTWPYAHLCYHSFKGGTLTIWFSAHVVRIHGRHLEEADDGLRLQSLVGLSETGMRRKDMLGEADIPEDQPAIDSIRIEDRKED